MDIVVTGIGLLTALGNLEETWRSLLQGRSAIRRSQPFAELPDYPLALMGDRPKSLQDLVLPLVQSACEDAGLKVPLPDCAVVLGSSRGNQARQEQQLVQQCDARELHQNPFDWLELLPHYAAVEAARYLQTMGEVHAPMAACATGLVAIHQALRLFQDQKCDRVLVGAIDTPITPLSLAGFEKMGALAKTGCYPFDLDREGLVLGEGGAVLILERREIAEARGAKIYGSVLGSSINNDAFHLSAPEPTGKLALHCVKDCLDRAQRKPETIDYIHAHGTATRLNDAREAQLIQTHFATASVSSSKGAIGHTLGASGAIGMALCCKALQTQTLPPSVGLNRVEYEAIDWVRSSRTALLQTVLCVSFGFGGQNAAIVLGRDIR